MSNLVSVIIPTYNRARLLTRALDSVWTQTHRPIEIIVVDDGSTDDTSNIVSSWKANHLHKSCEIKYVYKDNSGPAASRNVGLRTATGDYLYFLDSDDYMYPNLVEEAVCTLETEKSDCVIFGFTFSSPQGIFGEYCPPVGVDALEAYLAGSLWGYTSSALSRTALISSVGNWNESLSISEDYEFLGKVLFSSKKTSALNKFLMNVSRGEKSLSSFKNSTEGLKDQLNAEKTIVNLVSNREGVPLDALNAYSNRLFKKAINMYAHKESEFAYRLGCLAMEVDFGPWTFKDKLKRYIWRNGGALCVIWVRATSVLSYIRKRLLLNLT